MPVFNILNCGLPAKSGLAWVKQASPDAVDQVKPIVAGHRSAEIWGISAQIQIRPTFPGQSGRSGQPPGQHVSSRLGAELGNITSQLVISLCLDWWGLGSLSALKVPNKQSS